MALFRRTVKDPRESLSRIRRIIQEGDLPVALEMLEDLHRRCDPGTRAEVERTMSTARRRLVEDLLARSGSCDDPREASALLASAREWAGGDADLEAQVARQAPAAPEAASPEPERRRGAGRDTRDEGDEQAGGEESLVAESPSDAEAAAFELLLANADEEEARQYAAGGPEFEAAYGAFQRGAYPEAAAILRGLAERFPGAAYLRFHLASAEAAAGNWTEAAREYASFLENRTGAAFSPTVWAAFLGLSECLESSGHAAEAVATLERCVASHPEEAMPRFHLAALYRAQGRPRDAMEHLDRLRHDPDVRADADLRISTAREYAICLAALGRHEQARGELQRYLEQASGRRRGEFWDGDVMELLADTCDALGDREAAGGIRARIADRATRNP